MTVSPAALNAYWMPFTANRDFKKNPRIIVGAEGHYYHTDDGRKVYDTFSGLWTCGLGHCHPKIVAAVQQQVARLDYAMGFQAGHDKVFELAEQVTALAPEPFQQIFFTNSGSESVDTALKIALAYHRVRGEGHRTRLIGRERGYHGVNFGGMSVADVAESQGLWRQPVAGGRSHAPHLGP
jgi:beta-alanine--pyruvate transaminase